MLLKDNQTKASFVQGNTACAQAALDAGVRFFAGYPITPSSEIAEILSRKLPMLGGKFIQMEDEIASMGAILGASLTGKKVLTSTSGPGFSLKQELIGFASLCEIPCVIVNVQRGGPSTGLPTSPAQGDVMQSRWGTHGDHPIIVLSPSTVKETYDLTVRAFNLTESLRVPVILLSDEITGHIHEKIEFPDKNKLKLLSRPKAVKNPGKKYLPFAVSKPEEVPRVANFGEGFRFNVTGLLHNDDGFPMNLPEKNEFLLTRLHKKITSRIRELCTFVSIYLNDSETIIFSYGSTSRSCFQAAKIARSKGSKVGAISIKTLWPFPDFLIQELASCVKRVVVCEMNMGQIVHEVQRASDGRFKIEKVNSISGSMITPGEILDKIL